MVAALDNTAEPDLLYPPLEVRNLTDKTADMRVQWLGRAEGLLLDQDFKLIGDDGKGVGASKVLLSIFSPLMHELLKGQCECAEPAVVLVPWAHHNTLNKFNNAINKIFNHTGTKSDAHRIVDHGNREERIKKDSIQKQEFFTLMKELNICPEFQEMIWSFSDEKDDEKEVSSMETATISSSSKVSCENAKSEKQSQTDESLLSFSDNLQFFCPRTGQTEFVEVLHPTSGQGIESCITKKPSLETLPMEMLDLVIKQLDIESKKNLRLANRYFLEMMRKLEKVLMKHWKFKIMSRGKLKRLADQVRTIKGIEFNDEKYEVQSGLKYLLKEHMELESIIIGGSGCTNRILQAVFSHPSMKTIHFNDCVITGEIGKTNTKLALKVLKLISCDYLTDVGLVCLFNRIEGESLTELDLSHCGSRKNTLTMVSSCSVTFPNLEILNLWNCGLSDDILLTFFSKTGEKLKKLVLGANSISLSSINSLATGLPWMEKLILGSCDNLSEAGLISLLNKVGVHLIELDLSFNDIELSQAGSLTATFPKLRDLNLKGCENITEVGLLSLLNKTGCGNSLKTLNLNWSHVGEDCVTNVRAQYPNIIVSLAQYW